MAKITVSAKEISADIRSGMDNSDLMEKYQLSDKGLQSVFRKLMDSGVLKREELEKRTPLSEKTVEIAWKCPACGKPQMKEADVCPDCGVIVAKLRQTPAKAEDDVQQGNILEEEKAVEHVWKCSHCGKLQTEPFDQCPQCGSVGSWVKTPKTLAPQRAERVDDFERKIVAQTKLIINDIKGIHFSQEIIPIDTSNVEKLKGDFIFWSLSFLGVVPLMIMTLSNNADRLFAFSLFFAMIWGFLFKKLVMKDTVGWKLPLLAFFFTGIIGVWSLLLILAAFPEPEYLFSSSTGDYLQKLIGFVLRVGLWEESCKMFPVIIYVLWQLKKRKLIDPSAVVVIGIFSALGFAAFENIGYAGISAKLGAYGREEAVRGAMVNVLLRSLSLVFCHAVWSGCFAYFVATAALTGKRWGALFISWG